MLLTNTVCAYYTSILGSRKMLSPGNTHHKVCKKAETPISASVLA